MYFRRCSRTRSARASCTTCARVSTATCSVCRSPSSPERAPARCSAASRTTSAGSRRVVTSTATSVVSNVTTVVATVVAMFLLDWRLAVFALALLPLVRLAHEARRRAAQEGDDRAAGVTGRRLLDRPGVALRVAASCSARRWAGRTTSPRAFSGESRRLADLEVRSRMAGRWLMAVDPDDLRDHARARLLVRRLALFERLAGDHDRHARRLHHAADAASSSRSAACSASRSRCRPRSRCSTASSSTSTYPSTSSSATTRSSSPSRAARSRFEYVWFRYDDAWPGRCRTCHSPFRRARRRRSSARRGRARRRSAISSRGSTT